MHTMRDVTGTLRHTRPHLLENWLGKDVVEKLSRDMKDFYWPIPVHGVPGRVYAMPGGNFVGEIKGGQAASAEDRARDVVRKIQRSRSLRMALTRKQTGAFASLSALINAGTGGKAQNLSFFKTGVASNAIGNCIDLWTALTSQPAAGSAGAAAPGGTSPTNATQGALPYVNPANANTGHFATGYVTGSVIANTLLLYDRLFAVAKTMNNTGTEAVTGTFSRYQSATGTNSDYIGGNFCFPSDPTTVLPATAHNWTVCQYTNQAGTTGQSFPSIAGVSACVLRGVDIQVGYWFMPLAAGDVGVKALTQMQCSALVATGTIDFVVGHPIAFFPVPVANMVCIVDGINTAFSLAQVYDNAALAFLEMPKPAVGATNYSGLITVVAE